MNSQVTGQCLNTIPEINVQCSGFRRYLDINNGPAVKYLSMFYFGFEQWPPKRGYSAHVVP